MNKINLCVDIDSTLTKPDYWVDYFNKHFNTNYSYSDDTVEKYLEKNDVDYRTFDDFYHKYAEEMHKTAEIRPDAVDNIKKLEEFCNIYYVTARESHIEPITIEWLKKHGIYNDTFHLGSFNKSAKAKDLECDIFIEDHLETSKNLVKEGIMVLLIDTGFNRYENPDKIKRVLDWNQIYKEVEYFYKKIKK